MEEKYKKTYMKEKERVQQIKDRISRSNNSKYLIAETAETGCICTIYDESSGLEIYEGETVIRYQNAYGMQIGEIRKDSAYTISPFELRRPGNENDTILENAIKYQIYDSPQINKRVKDTVKSALYMLTDLGIELTPAEKLQMLRMKKEDLEEELAKINDQIKQYEGYRS